MPARDNPPHRQQIDAYKYASRLMNKPSERIVVFVSPAQKRAIAATAEELGISISELMRRAVLNFGATSEQVKAASIVDRLRAPREPDALNAALQRVARSAKANREALPPALRGESSAGQKASVNALDQPHRDGVPQPQPVTANAAPVPAALPASVPAAVHASAPASSPASAPVDPLQALAAMAGETTDAGVDEAVRAAEAQAAADAAARVAAAKAAALRAAKSPSKSKPSTGTSARDESPFIDPTEGTGRFA
jgi:hypothetical protein